MSKLVILAAGGTGGHLFPAQALGEVLRKRGYRIHLMTDERVHDYGKNFPCDATHIIESASPSPKRPMGFLKLLRGYLSAKKIMRREKPAAVIGFGGYPSFPPIYAAAALKIPSLVHEQNSVLGRANKLLATKVNAVAGSFEKMFGLSDVALRKLVVTGNPVRSIALAHAQAAYPSFNGKIKLVVFGGSQGAKFFSDFMPQVFAQMPAEILNNISLTQQCRVEDIDLVKVAYQNIDAELQPFFMDMPKRIAECHLVICRSGASTIAELGVIGRPAIMVPLPHALDNDQLRNAESFARAGAGWVMPQKELDAASFAKFLSQLLENHAGLKRAAESALTHGKPDAAERLADLVEKTINSETLHS
jgi:UDP-N-acetylglucosamine--N-acetylmuramyl-(pentapeptide) pyrophosphoryl-undecaprenol N-acetylglucosamine transferase